MAETPPKINVGAFEVAFLADGLWRNDGGCMFGVVPRELWKGNHPPDERNRIRLNLTCPLIMKGADAVLVDTGIGNRLSDVERKIFDHGDGWLPNHLRALGMEAGDVTHLIVSHLHFDHCGGIVRRRDSGALEAAFPRARIFVQRGELEVADHPRNERLHAAYRHVGEILAPVRSMLEALDGDTDIIRDCAPSSPAVILATIRRSSSPTAANVSCTSPTSCRRARICADRGTSRTIWTRCARWNRRRTTSGSPRKINGGCRSRTTTPCSPRW